MIQKKVCMVGTSGVGKTSLVAKFVHSMFSDKYLTTVGVKIDKPLMSIMVSPLPSAMALAMRLIGASGSPCPNGRHKTQERLSGPLKRRSESRLLSQTL